MIYNLYLIRNNIDDIVYVGKTRQAICHRWSEHRTRYIKYKYSGRKHLYCSSSEMFHRYGVDNCYIELFRTIDVETLFKAELYEQALMNAFDSRCINERNVVSKYRIRKMEKLRLKKLSLVDAIKNYNPFTIIST